MSETSDITRWSAAQEGPFFERKSAFDRSSSRARQRKAADIARDIAETLTAMANADGGELVVGMENDGAATGVPHAEDKIRLLLAAPKDRNYVSPPLPCVARELSDPNGKRLLHFQVDWSPSVHLLADSRCLLRVGDSNQPFDKDKIKALKEAKHQGLFERTFPPGARIEDLNDALLVAFAARVAPGTPPRDALGRLRLVEGRNGHVVPTLAALLLFGNDPARWHDRCGIDFVRWEGTKRKSGAELNIAKRFRVEAPLAVLLERAFEAIRPFIRERQQLHDLFFIEKLEYPTFAWQEAIVNAVAHRDYSIRGLGVEVWMFDDRMEIRSPGMPPSPVTLDALAQRKHMHCSRNPLIVRVLTTMGYMRELGEGVPRMFDEMERAGYYPPRFAAIGGAVVQVTLRNEPIYDRSTLEWLLKFKEVELSGDQKRVLAYAHAHGDRFTSRDFQKVNGTDIYGASNAIKDMMRKGVVRSTEKGSRVYEVREPLKAQPDMPGELVQLLPTLQKKGRLTNADVRRVLGVARNTAARLLGELAAASWLVHSGKRGAGAFSTPGARLLHQPPTMPNTGEAGAMDSENGAMKP
ncbi:MAG: putative DNA binding domain-containing protein [Betaproteobacteria bacterium]|nr:putative DNA binding domain-containing protein [Betaproteobacteria bacterium]